MICITLPEKNLTALINVLPSDNAAKMEIMYED